MNETRAAIEADLRRIADRLRTAPVRRAEEAAPATRSVLQHLADLAAGTDARDAADQPRWRPVPELALGALGDQVAVLGADLVVSIRSAADGDTVWTPSGRTELGGALAALAAELAALRSSL